MFKQQFGFRTKAFKTLVGNSVGFHTVRVCLFQFGMPGAHFIEKGNGPHALCFQGIFLARVPVEIIDRKFEAGSARRGPMDLEFFLDRRPQAGTVIYMQVIAPAVAVALEQKIGLIDPVDNSICRDVRRCARNGAERREPIRLAA